MNYSMFFSSPAASFVPYTFRGPYVSIPYVPTNQPKNAQERIGPSTKKMGKQIKQPHLRTVNTDGHDHKCLNSISEVNAVQNTPKIGKIMATVPNEISFEEKEEQKVWSINIPIMTGNSTSRDHIYEWMCYFQQLSINYEWDERFNNLVLLATTAGKLKQVIMSDTEETCSCIYPFHNTTEKCISIVDPSCHHSSFTTLAESTSIIDKDSSSESDVDSLFQRRWRNIQRFYFPYSDFHELYMELKSMRKRESGESWEQFHVRFWHQLHKINLCLLSGSQNVLKFEQILEIYLNKLSADCRKHIQFNMSINKDSRLYRCYSEWKLRNKESEEIIRNRTASNENICASNRYLPYRFVLNQLMQCVVRYECEVLSKKYFSNDGNLSFKLSRARFDNKRARALERHYHCSSPKSLYLGGGSDTGISNLNTNQSNRKSKGKGKGEEQCSQNHLSFKTPWTKIVVDVYEVHENDSIPTSGEENLNLNPSQITLNIETKERDSSNDEAPCKSEEVFVSKSLSEESSAYSGSSKKPSGIYLIIMDLCTNWLELIPLHSHVTSKEIYDVMDVEWFCRYPAPEDILFTQHRLFQVKELKEVILRESGNDIMNVRTIHSEEGTSKIPNFNKHQLTKAHEYIKENLKNLRFYEGEDCEDSHFTVPFKPLYSYANRGQSNSKINVMPHFRQLKNIARSWRSMFHQDLGCSPAELCFGTLMSAPRDRQDIAGLLSLKEECRLRKSRNLNEFTLPKYSPQILEVCGKSL